MICVDFFFSQKNCWVLKQQAAQRDENSSTSNFNQLSEREVKLYTWPKFHDLDLFAASWNSCTSSTKLIVGFFRCWQCELKIFLFKIAKKRNRSSSQQVNQQQHEKCVLCFQHDNNKQFQINMKREKKLNGIILFYTICYAIRLGRNGRTSARAHSRSRQFSIFSTLSLLCVCTQKIYLPNPSSQAENPINFSTRELASYHKQWECWNKGKESSRLETDSAHIQQLQRAPKKKHRKT